MPAYQRWCCLPAQNKLTATISFRRFVLGRWCLRVSAQLRNSGRSCLSRSSLFSFKIQHFEVTPYVFITMMLSKREKEGCFAILHLLPDDEVMALAQTTTAHQIVLSNRKGKCQVVMSTFVRSTLYYSQITHNNRCHRIFVNSNKVPV